MKKIAISFVSLFLVSFALVAQNETIKFTETSHDFGNINEEKGPVEKIFKFKNLGKDTIRLTNVQASCGCTTPKWDKEAIMPGKEGTVIAKYDPMNRPGAFNKSITVTSTGNPSTTVLYIKGNVIPKPKTVADDFPTMMGGIRVKTSFLNLGEVSTKEPVTQEFEMYNDSKAPITFTDNIKAPAHVKVKIEPKVVEPGKKNKMIITYDAKAKNDYGYVSDEVQINSTEADGAVKTFTLTATVNEYFPPLTEEQKMKAPKLVFEKTTHDFGKLKQGDIVTTDFKFTNTGKQELVIRKSKASCGCTASEPDKKVLKPGESSNIAVTFNSTGRKGIEKKTITVISNDPANPVQVLSIQSEVMVDEAAKDSHEGHNH